MSDEQKVYIQTEQFKLERVEKEGEKTKVTFSGLALPFGKESRNQCTYDKKRALEVMHTLNGVPFLFNHNYENVLGHVISVEERKEGIGFKVDIDPEEKEFIRKTERGDYNTVSIGTIIDKVEEFEDENKVPNLFIKEFIELSSAPVPGFLDAKMDKEGFISMEKFLQTETNKYTKGNSIMVEDKDKEKPEEGETETEKIEAFMEGTKESLTKMSESIKSMGERIDEIEETLKATTETNEKLTKEFKKVETSLVEGQGTGTQEKTEYTAKGLSEAMKKGAAL